MLAVIRSGQKLTISDPERELLINVVDARSLEVEASTISDLLKPLRHVIRENARLEKAIKSVLMRAVAELDRLDIPCFLQAVTSERDDEDPSWEYVSIRITLYVDSRRFDDAWDKVSRAAYEGIDPAQASRILLTFQGA